MSDRSKKGLGASSVDALIADLLGPLLADALVIHDGTMVAVCPLSPEVESQFKALTAREFKAGGKVLPPGLAIVTSADRAVETLKLLTREGYNLDIQCANPGDAQELRQAIIAEVDPRDTYVSDVREKGGNSSNKPFSVDPTQN